MTNYELRRYSLLQNGDIVVTDKTRTRMFGDDVFCYVSSQWIKVIDSNDMATELAGDGGSVCRKDYKSVYNMLDKYRHEGKVE